MSKETKPEDGFTLVELIVSFGVLITVLLSCGYALTSGSLQQEDSFESYLLLSAMRDICAEIQEVANLDTNLTAQEGVGSLYSRYNGTTITIPNLPSATITITCFANESTVPNDLGGPQDLNFDGDSADNHTNQSNGSDMKLVPMQIQASFTDNGISQTLTTWRLVTTTRD